MLLFDHLSGCSNISHFMTTCQGGVSKEEYASFNLGEFAGDNPENVLQNREILAAELGLSLEQLIFPYQIHQDKVLRVNEALINLSPDLRKEAMSGYDALVTNLPNVCIGVTTADCVPLLAFDPQKCVLAAVHAGWRGTVACIVLKTIDVMCREYGCLPENILFGIGAAISVDKFEVGEEVVAEFQKASIDLMSASYRHPKTGKCHIDLQLVNKNLLLEAGIPDKNIEIMPLCTQSRADLFFSARRQGVKSGRMVTGGFIRE